MSEWHFYNDQFHGKESGEYGWRKTATRPHDEIIKWRKGHLAGPDCHKLCRDGQWPIPHELVTSEPERVSGAFGYQKKEHAESWWVLHSGRVFLLIRHNGRTRNLVCEMEYREHQPYSWVPNYPKGKVWDWISVQSKEGY